MSEVSTTSDEARCGWEDELEACKKLERPEMVDWEAFELASRWWPLMVEEYGSPEKGKEGGVLFKAPAREEARTLSASRFREVYEAGSRPCVVVGSKVAEQPEWTAASLAEKYGGLNWRTSDTHGGMLGLDEWVAYGASTRDDAPLGLYDSEIFDYAPELADGYAAPDFCSKCDFSRLSERPPWRWLLMGCPRSGTGLHIDPLLTHAWVYLTSGRKLWAMLPPGAGEIERQQTPSAVWFFRNRDRLRARDDYLEFVQHPGELVYIPAGWEHAVLNLDWTVAVTENYAVLDDRLLETVVKDEAPAVYASFRTFRDILAPTAFRIGLRRILDFLPTVDVVSIAPAARLFEEAALRSPSFWVDRIRTDFGVDPNSSTFQAVFGGAAIAARRQHLKQRQEHQQQQHDEVGPTSSGGFRARDLRIWYLMIQFSHEMERFSIYHGLC